jgi:protein-L-isoaspartate O-methyltransferase
MLVFCMETGGSPMHLFEKIVNAIEDFRLGIRANGTAKTDKPGAVYYATIRHNLIREVLDQLRLSMDDEFIDIGCGKGRVLAIAATYPIGSILGIEYEPALANIAKSNVARQSHPRIGVCHGAAEDFDYSKITVAYAFNPVEPDVLDLILAKIDRDRMNVPFGMRRSFRIAYVSESPAHRAIFASHSWLERYHGFTNSGGHPISFYRSGA